MRSLFISYRSSDAAQVDKIARDLTLLRNADGTARYTTWQDKHNLPPASPNWWDAIVDAILATDMFVFNISKASLQSEVCRAELDYAYKLNLPIIPVVLDGEFFLDPKSGKYNIDYWDLIPDWLAERQFLFYLGAEFFNDFEEAVAMFERSWPRRLSAQRPLNPDSKSVHGSNHALYDAACDYAGRLAFADAEKHFAVFLRRNDPVYADIAAQWLELLRLYAELIEIDGRSNTRFLFKNKWANYNSQFPKEFLDGIFDPKDLNARYGNGAVLTPTTEPVVKFSTQSIIPTRFTSLDLMPAPFAWIDIPHESEYCIAKYPITNAQFAKFIDANGYEARQWWSLTGWKARITGWDWDSKQSRWHQTGYAWSHPRYWFDKMLNNPEKPVVGVSWYEASAFCLWLAHVTGEKIMLPTEAEWQYAAQADDDRIYPWGNKWNNNLCNNGVGENSIGTTTDVWDYEEQGKSPFGVVDMAGNVSEWCLMDHGTYYDDPPQTCSIRGGSWIDLYSDNFRCDFQEKRDQRSRSPFIGFRISRSLAIPF